MGLQIYSQEHGNDRKWNMARKHSQSASKDVERALHKEKRGKLKSGKGGKGGTVKSHKQAIAIGLSEARAEGKKVPAKKKTAKKKASGKKSAKKKTAKKRTAKISTTRGK